MQEALAWLDAKWDAIVVLLADRDPARADQVWVLTQERIALDGGTVIGANVCAAPFVQHLLDLQAHVAWLQAYSAVYSIWGAEVTRLSQLHRPPDAPDSTPPEPAEHSAS